MWRLLLAVHRGPSSHPVDLALNTAMVVDVVFAVVVVAGVGVRGVTAPGGRITPSSVVVEVVVLAGAAAVLSAP